MTRPLPFRDFTAEEHGTWRRLFERQAVLRDQQLVPRFGRGLRALGIDSRGVPDLERVNRELRKRSGFQGVPVAGLESPAEFFAMLARRDFPIGNFIRSPEDLSYTPAPDVFHDLYGHLPFLAEVDYADFCQEFGSRAGTYANDPAALRAFDRLFWFTIEFALEETPEGLRIFGAGTASSFAECAYALGPEPEVLPFDPVSIRDQDFRIDVFQSRLYRLRSDDELFTCLDSFEEALSRTRAS